MKAESASEILAACDEHATNPNTIILEQNQSQTKLQAVMKPFISYSFLAALAASSLASAQTTARTTPVGYVTQELAANRFNLVGVTLHSSVAASGQVASVSGMTLTASSTDFSSILEDGRTYILEVTSGAEVGLTQEFTIWSGSTLTTVSELANTAIAAGDQFKIRVAPTLEETFGTTESVLQKGAIASLADIVWIPTGAGTYDRYFLHTTNTWRNATTSAVAPNIPLVYLDGVLIEKRASAASLVISGEVKTTPSAFAVSTGFNVASAIYPVGSTLQNSGLNDDLQSGAIASLADIVWFPNDAGGYDRYFYHTTGTWRNATTSAVLSADVPVPSAYLIERRGATVSVGVTPPASYSDL